MNKRIRELMIKATGMQNALVAFDSEGVVFSKEDMVNFAELIIEECKKAIDPTDDLCSMMEEVGRYNCVSIIDKHFGVK
jgi:hypothetical protein